jgi:hypothetical protein
MPSARDISVFSDDPSYLGRVLDALPPGGDRFDLVGWPEVQRASEEGSGLSKNVLVFAAASALPNLAPFLHSTNRRHHLSALLVRDDEPEWIPQLLARANVRALRNMLVTREGDTDVPRRVLLGWALGAPGEMIADARVMGGGERLLVVSCAMNQTECAFDDIPALAQVPGEERPDFEVASDGSYLHWPASGVDLDLEALRYYTDAEPRRRRADRERLARSEQFGAAVATVRGRHGLRQTDVEGLSARQVRRIEKGESEASASALEKLAEAHGLRANDYLEEVAEELSSASRDASAVIRK